jgi:hypothetical protein
MFPGYFFAQFDYVTERRRVEHALGVRGLVQFGDRLATMIQPSLKRCGKEWKRTNWSRSIRR